MSNNIVNPFTTFSKSSLFPDGLGSAVDGTCSGVTYNQTGHFGAGTAFTFSSGDNIDLNDDIIAGTGDYSMTCWVNYPSSSGTGIIFQRGFPQQTSGGTYIGTCLARHNATGKMTGYPMNLNQTSALSQGSWHFVAMVRASGTATLYIDGSSNASVSDSTDNKATDGAYTANFSLGDDYTSVSPASNAGQSASAFNAVNLVASLSEVSIWNVALSSGNISTIWNSGTGLTIQAYVNAGNSGSGCLAYYNFTETSGDLINRAIP